VEYRTLGKTGLTVSAVGFGGWAIGGGLGTVRDETSHAAVERALERGITFFDTADCYGFGRSEVVLGEVLRGVRDDVVIATKAGSDFYARHHGKRYDRDHLCMALAKSLERMGLERVDLFQLHDPPIDAILSEETISSLEHLKAEGLCRHIGASVHTLEEARAVVMAGVYETLQIAYSVAYQWVPNRVLPAAREAGLGVIAREPLSQGLLTGKYDRDYVFPEGDWRSTLGSDLRVYLDALQGSMRRYFHGRHGMDRSLAALCIQLPLQHPAVSTVIVSCKTRSQVDRNVAVTDLPPLTRAQLAWLRE
jgi:aryl-alcohol dehydrogenase-like predicted oxidoreductase